MAATETGARSAPPPEADEGTEASAAPTAVASTWREPCQTGLPLLPLDAAAVVAATGTGARSARPPEADEGTDASAAPTAVTSGRYDTGVRGGIAQGIAQGSLLERGSFLFEIHLFPRTGTDIPI